MSAPKPSLNLTMRPEIVHWPETHYVFIEKVGPFEQTAPAAWNALHQLIPIVEQHNKITGYTSQYKVAPKIYRAGVSLSAEPKNLPADLHHEKFAGGKYAAFILTGPYSNLPEACGRAFQMVADQKIPLRDDDWYLENYTNDPRTTPESELVTQILIPTT